METTSDPTAAISADHRPPGRDPPSPDPPSPDPPSPEPVSGERMADDRLHDDLSNGAPTTSTQVRRAPHGDGALIDRADVMAAVGTMILAINLVSVVGVWRLRPRETSPSPVAPLRFIADVNSAPASELALLPGIGQELADRIVADRQAGGPFQSATDLRRVRGIGPKTIVQLESMIVFGSPNDDLPPSTRESNPDLDQPVAGLAQQPPPAIGPQR